jgi:hypothetical protein
MSLRSFTSMLDTTMTHNVFNSEASRAGLSKSTGATKRIVAPDWNGQAAPSRAPATVQVKTGSFKVEVSAGKVTVKKSTRQSK